MVLFLPADPGLQPMTLSTIPVLCDLPAAEQTDLLNNARQQDLIAGEVLRYQGDTADTLYVLVRGECTLSRDGVSQGTLSGPELVDPAAVLGGLPHSVKVTAATGCRLLCWPVNALWQSQTFSAAARHYLAASLQQTQARLNELETPVHYRDPLAGLVPGPFLFEDATMIIAFCEARRDAFAPTLPDGLSLLNRPGRGQVPVFVAFARFPNAYPEADPGAQFAYTETTVFVPVRYGKRVGLFVPYIYPSTWEPILLGREIYGFPKRLGQTIFGPRRVSLKVNGIENLDLQWEASEASDEPRLVRALIDWLGLEGRAGALAFRAGDTLRRVMHLPPYRRVEVFNHKRALDVAARFEKPVYAIDCLTHAAFGVLRWYQIARIRGATLNTISGPLAGTDLTLREAYWTQLDMRLSEGRVLCTYLDMPR